MAKKQMTFEQKLSKGHVAQEKFIKLVCSYKSEKGTWKFAEKFVGIKDPAKEDEILETNIKKMVTTV
ncbi:MAG TPA: hypothetical protein PLP19_13065 [bacterium]|mgnify:CR=1 FL=1|nr:hypothetical protein [bacterium]HPN44416.1 hypothetical protein [bacterium]